MQVLGGSSFAFLSRSQSGTNLLGTGMREFGILTTRAARAATRGKYSGS